MMSLLPKRTSVNHESAETRIRIASKKDGRLPFFAAWLAAWTLGPLSMMKKAVQSLTGTAPEWFNLLWGVGWLWGITFASWFLLWGLGGVETLYLRPESIELQESLFGLTFRRRRAPVNDVRNLRYVPASTQSRRSRESSICYEDEKGTVRFGSGLDDAEALKIIDQMLAVHVFAKRDRAMEYIDLS